MKKNVDKHFIKYSFFLFCFLSIISWIYIFFTELDVLSSLFNEKNVDYFIKFIKRLLGLNETVPAYLDKEMWKEGFSLSLQTFKMSILATGIASFGMFIFVISSARNILDGSLTLYRKWYYTPFII